MLKVGILGFGFMGRMHYANFKKFKDIEITAICDSRADILSTTQQSKGNIAGAEGSVDFSGLNLYSDFDELLKNENLDAVSITLPTHLHAKFSKMALEAGMHVFCEKPMALNVSQCTEMIAAAKQSGKCLQVGHCLRFWPECAKAKEIVQSEQYGKVLAATFQRLGSLPDWSVDNWFMDDKRSGGMALDLHIHDTDFVQYLFGLPAAVSSFGASTSSGQLIHIVTEYLFDDNMVVTAEGSWAVTPSYGFEASFNIIMEKATITYGYTRSPTLRVCPADGESFTPEIDPADGYYHQFAHFINLINGKNVPEVTTLEQSRNSVMIVNAEIESVHKSKPISIEKT